MSAPLGTLAADHEWTVCVLSANGRSYQSFRSEHVARLIAEATAEQQPVDPFHKVFLSRPDGTWETISTTCEIRIPQPRKPTSDEVIEEEVEV